ncbi:GAF domain-containing protein [Methylobacillus flagellatus]|uniref:HD domain-containing phosphohydrolase n=1 Tax=Methylobacillus flagellatus TaxID=405 RepID=UPI00285396F5|nr:HD domain-containing phosphohydrolase [Methylobacillus flagellatus]MDR5170533.1 GAF domain-containing protein [Methylobacillus flagellatus]
MTARGALVKQLEDLNAIGIALSAEHDHQRLLEMIVMSAKRLTNADAGTLYSVTQDKTLRFEIMRTSSLGIAMGGTTGNPIPFQPLPLYLASGQPNHHMVAAYAVLNDCTVNIEDAYYAEGFDFSGTRQFDATTGYRSRSFLTVPMKNHEGEIIGVLQLINAKDAAGQIVPFSDSSQQLVESLASQAAVALTNRQLIEGLRNLFEAFIRLIAGAIDAKSPYTGGHCRRVPELAMMLAAAVNRAASGPLKDFYMNGKELDELRIAAWLHDCGKIATPESLMDKPTKLSTIFDRIGLLEQRFALMKKQAECRLLRQQLDAVRQGREQGLDALERQYADWIRQLDDDLAFLQRVNVGSESMPAEDQERVKKIAQYQLEDESGKTVNFLTEDEVYNLTISSGTLTPEERQVVNQHIVVTIDMLESLPYPPGLQRVPEYAGGHHERLDGHGYPRGLTKEQLSIPARLMCIADIFEALTSGDRPYKKAKTLSEALHILGEMKLDQHIDPDLFDIFIREKVYLHYARRYLQPGQIDAVDEAAIPGYAP